jgi:chorismate synthase
VIRAAIKPIPSIAIEQDTIDKQGTPQRISVKGRHDISAIPRVNVVCEAMVCLVLADHLLRQQAILSVAVGTGDYTRDRENWLNNISFKEIISEIKSRNIP